MLVDALTRAKMSEGNPVTVNDGTSVSKESNPDYTQAINDGIVVLENGIKVINSSPHPFVFDDGTTVPSCGISLNCDFVENEATPKDIFSDLTFVTVTKMPRAEGIAFLDVVPIGVLVLGSAHAAEAYGFPVVMPVPTPDSKRAPSLIGESALTVSRLPRLHPFVRVSLWTVFETANGHSKHTRRCLRKRSHRFFGVSFYTLAVEVKT